jgi:hypothetical protein
VACDQHRQRRGVQRLLASKKVAVVVTARGDGTSKVRPIAVGETFSTIIERWLLRDLGDSVAAAVGPYQTGVGGSASSVGVGVAAALRADPASVAVTWDLANSYGSVQRADVMEPAGAGPLRGLAPGPRHRLPGGGPPRR